MSTFISNHFIQQWGDNIRLLSQQMGSKLAGTVEKETVNGEAYSTEQVGTVDFAPIVGRNGDTTHSDTPHYRRWGVTAPFFKSSLIDKQDLVRTLNDPTNKYTQAFIAGAGRKIDDVIVAAMTATAYTGKQFGSLTTAFDTTNNLLYKDATLISNGTGSGTAQPLTTEKIIRAREILRNNDVPEEDCFIAVHPKCMSALLAETKVGSADYNAVRALQAGELKMWLGFNFVITTRITAVVSPNIYRNYAYHRSGMSYGVAQDPTFRITEESTKHFSTQVYARMDIGAVRLEETKVVAIDADVSIRAT